MEYLKHTAHSHLFTGIHSNRKITYTNKIGKKIQLPATLKLPEIQLNTFRSHLEKLYYVLGMLNKEKLSKNCVFIGISFEKVCK